MPSPSTLIALMAASSVISVMAQSDSPYIPSSGISSQCSTFLEDLDSNTELATCSSRLLSATQLFDPSSTSNSPSSSQVQSSLSSLCSSTNNACSEQLITRHLTYFSGNCTPELAANHPVVRSNYDVLYVLYPFTKAVCAKDSVSNEYCATRINDEDAVQESASSSSSSSPSSSGSTASNATVFSNANGASGSTGSLFIQAPQVALNNLYMHISDATRSAISRLRKRQAVTSSNVPNTGAANSTSSSTTTTATAANTVNDANALLPNATTFRTTNLPFLFLSGDMGQKQLCTECTKNVLAAYVGFETDYPYGTGLSNSPILGAQASLWNDIGKVCGSGFLSSITAQSGNNISGASKSVFVGSPMVVAGLAGLVGCAFVL
ncbi:hypothetical protein P389DRAFT_58673 [Cystobasidium minutum MCA 4210]|uniref:uncharacterized protein n=1 Tax=Cystobasidium minutum MCA 4210 TaxID=1397322 RepID=UPI0034CD23AF|eukprot:jgi/Rhomi1/58673/CE58672_692